ncbi:hypothetical protein ACFL6S_00755 [Candidatus Poribacteria bacterium]
MKALTLPINLIVIIAIAIIVLLALSSFFMGAAAGVPEAVNNESRVRLLFGRDNSFYDRNTHFTIHTQCEDRVVCYTYSSDINNIHCFRDADLVEKYCNTTEASEI